MKQLQPTQTPSFASERHNHRNHSEAFVAYHDIHEALTDQDPVAALESLDRLTTQDIIWRLSSENEIYRTFEPHLPEKVKADIQESIVADALTLATHRLTADQLLGLGLGPEYYDDAGISQPPTLKDALLLAQSWDSTDRNPLIGELLAVTLDTLDEAAASEPKQALQLALEEDISFNEARLRIEVEIDQRLDVEWLKVGHKLKDKSDEIDPAYDWMYKKS